SATGGGAGDNFGKAVSLDGNRLLVAAHLADAGSTNDAGAAYVFDYASNDWTEKVKLTALVPLTPTTATHSLGDHRARFRDDETGRWVTRDPLEYLAGNYNLYVIAYNNTNVFFDPSGLAPTYEEAIELDPQDDNPHGWKWDPRDPSSPYHHRWKKEQENKKRREVYRQRRARADKLKEPFEDAERREYERRKEYIDETRRKLESGRCVIVKIITGEEDKWWDCMASCMNIPVQVLKAGGKQALKHWIRKKGRKAAA